MFLQRNSTGPEVEALGVPASFDVRLVFSAPQGQDFLFICSLHLPCPTCGFNKPRHLEPLQLLGGW